jgi:Tfp pilus assembly protein PilO
VTLDDLIRKRLGTLLAVGAAVVVANLVLYFTVVQRMDHSAESAKDTVSRNRKVIRELEGREKAAAATVERVTRDKQVLRDLESKVLATRETRLVAAQEELKKIIEGCGILMPNLGYVYQTIPKGREASAGWQRHYVKVSISVPVVGTYPAIKKLIADLQASPQFFLIDDVSLTSQAQGGVELHVNLAVSTYFVLPAGQAAADDAGGGA